MTCNPGLWRTVSADIRCGLRRNQTTDLPRCEPSIVLIHIQLKGIDARFSGDASWPYRDLLKYHERGFELLSLLPFDGFIYCGFVIRVSFRLCISDLAKRGKL